MFGLYMYFIYLYTQCHIKISQVKGILKWKILGNHNLVDLGSPGKWESSNPAGLNGADL